MIRVVLPLAALLAGVALLLAGSGLLGTLLAVRGGIEGFDDRTLGLVMSGYFAGFFIGTFLAPPLVRRSRIEEDPDGFFRMVETLDEPNSETHIDRLDVRGAWARYGLAPLTGKRHQLRVHLDALGLPIAGDQFYPRVRRGPDGVEDFTEPLRLLASAIAFTDPVTGQARRFESARTLDWPLP